MESSYVPPEIASQFAQQSDQQGDDEQDSSGSTQSQSQATDDSSSMFGGTDPGTSPSGGIPGMSGSDPVGQHAGDSGSQSGPQESLTLRQQLVMLSPLGILQALSGQIVGEKTQEQQQAEQQAQSRLQQLQQGEKQSAQMAQQRSQAEQNQISQQVDMLKRQGRSFGGRQGSVLYSNTTSGDQSELALTEQAVRDAQHEAAKRRQQGGSDPGSKAKQGPASMGDLAQQKSGMQKASEMSMGE